MHTQLVAAERRADGPSGCRTASAQPGPAVHREYAEGVAGVRSVGLDASFFGLVEVADRQTQAGEGNRALTLKITTADREKSRRADRQAGRRP